MTWMKQWCLAKNEIFIKTLKILAVKTDKFSLFACQWIYLQKITNIYVKKEYNDDIVRNIWLKM